MLAGGTALLAVPKFAQFKAALQTLLWSMRGLSIAGGATIAGLTAFIAIVGAVSAAQAEARQRAEAYADALAQGEEEATRNMIAQNLTVERSFLWLSLRTATEAARRNRNAPSTWTRAMVSGT